MIEITTQEILDFRNDYVENESIRKYKIRKSLNLLIYEMAAKIQKETPVDRGVLKNKVQSWMASDSIARAGWKDSNSQRIVKTLYSGTNQNAGKPDMGYTPGYFKLGNYMGTGNRTKGKKFITALAKQGNPISIRVNKILDRVYDDNEQEILPKFTALLTDQLK